MKKLPQKSMLSRPEVREQFKFNLQSMIQSTIEASGSYGKLLMLKHLNGSILTAREAIIAHCFQCQGGYRDGKRDCQNYLCHFYPRMPYGQLRYVRRDRREKKN